MGEMILSDKNIREFGDRLITEGYNPDNVQPASYDLTIGSIIVGDREETEYTIRPDELLFIKTAEQISMPDNLLGVIGERNSRMRMGLWVSGPHYFPGHKTFMFLRVKNLSANPITIKKGEGIAQIFFEEMKEVPEVPYDKKKDASFNDETEYRGLGRYTDEYSQRIANITSEKAALENTQGRMYANILTLMGLFVSIFSLIMVNFSQINSGNAMDKRTILTINLSLGFVIALFLGLIFLVINKAEKRYQIYLFAATLVVLLIALVLL